jgi:hypothetical protein
MDDIKLEEEEEECLMERDEDMEPASSTPAPNRDQGGAVLDTDPVGSSY